LTVASFESVGKIYLSLGLPQVLKYYSSSRLLE